MMIESYMTQLCAAFGAMEATPATGKLPPHYLGYFEIFVETLRQTHECGCKVVVVGNGGSAGIASHVAIDLNKAAGVRAMTLTDSAALTCLANDYGEHLMFAKQIEYLGRHNDMLIAISSSGESPDIIYAVESAWTAGMRVVTFSGFDDDNDLRRRGEMNFYVPSHHYGFVELSHQIFLHAAVDALAEARK